VVVLVLAALAALPGRALAVSEQVPIGPRAIALAGAYSSLADDATALFWNPAGLARIGHQELATSRADLYHSGIVDNVLSFALPISPNQAAATNWYSSGFDDGELGFGENRVSVGWSARVGPGVWAGVSGKWLSRRTSLDGFDLRSEQGLGADAGLLFAPVDRVHLALVAQDAFGTRLRAADGTRSLAYPRNLRLGASYAWRRAGTVAFDLDDRWHAGVELTPHPVLALRVGTEADLHRIEGNTWTYGLGITAGYVHMDWAHVAPPILEPTDHLAISLQFNWNPAQVRIEKIQPRELYTSFYKSYATQPFGTVTLHNLQDRSLEARLSVFIPEMMTAPSQQQVILRPKVSQEFALTAVLDERVVSQRGDQPVQVQVEAAYQSRRLERKERASMRTVAFAPGAIDWDLGMDQAAAYVTPRDPAVDALARSAAHLVTQRSKDTFGNRNLGFAAALTEAVAQVGVAYVPDPSTPFATVAGTPHAVDTISYPFETLAKRSGDCDDTTVLMASLLANVGVETKFVDAPGHILLLFDTALSERNRAALGVDTTLTVVLDGQVWAPLETTALSKGFLEAWQIGAEEIVKWSERDQIHYWGVTEARKRYESATPPGVRRLAVLDTVGLDRRLAADERDYGMMRDSYFTATYGGTGRDLEASASALIEIASLTFLGGDLEGARTQLESALAKAPQSVAVHNDLGVVLALLGRMPDAVEHLRTATVLGSRDAGVLLNLGVAQCAGGDSTAGRESLAHGAELAGGFGPACALLELPSAEPAQRASASPDGADATEFWLRAQLRAALSTTPVVRAGSARRPAQPPAGTGAAAPAITSGTRPIPPGLQRHFHWKE
jgi:hypothetical protein